MDAAAVVVKPVVRRVQDAHDPGVDRAAFDYADCFEVTAPAPAGQTVEALARAALEGMPRPLRVLVMVIHRRVLRFRLGPLGSAEHVLGWRIVESTDERLVLHAEGPLMRAVLVGRTPNPGVTVLCTFVAYRAPAARLVWRVVGPVHRRVAPLLLKRASSG